MTKTEQTRTLSPAHGDTSLARAASASVKIAATTDLISPPRAWLQSYPQLLPGTRVRVTQFIRHGHRDTLVARELIGTVVEQTAQPTGSWFAHPRSKKVELHRLLIRKADGELSLLAIDDRTHITVLDVPADWTGQPWSDGDGQVAQLAHAARGPAAVAPTAEGAAAPPAESATAVPHTPMPAQAEVQLVAPPAPPPTGADALLAPRTDAAPSPALGAARGPDSHMHIQTSSATAAVAVLPAAPQTQATAATAPARTSLPAGAPKAEVTNLDFYYGKFHALKNVNLPIVNERATALIGPSGCGKSTLLRCFNRMHDLYPGNRYVGEIKLFPDNFNIVGSGVNPISVRMRIGMVFQKPNPFPKSIFENVAYGLRIRGVGSRSELMGRVERALRDAAIWEETKDRLRENAMNLSGGQQQRLCIARTLAAEPEIILFDEPTSALDPIATGKIEELLTELKKQVTIVIVTHNMQQAVRISDYTAFMYLGELIEYAPTDDLFNRPKHELTKEYVTGRFG